MFYLIYIHIHCIGQADSIKTSITHDKVIISFTDNTRSLSALIRSRAIILEYL